MLKKLFKLANTLLKGVELKLKKALKVAQKLAEAETTETETERRVNSARKILKQVGC